MPAPLGAGRAWGWGRGSRGGPQSMKWHPRQGRDSSWGCVPSSKIKTGSLSSQGPLSSFLSSLWPGLQSGLQFSSRAFGRSRQGHVAGLVHTRPGCSLREAGKRPVTHPVTPSEVTRAAKPPVFECPSKSPVPGQRQRWWGLCHKRHPGQLGPDLS